MSDTAGYTLFEMLVALAVLGLAMAGLASGVQVLTRWQTATNALAIQAQSVRLAQTRLDSFFDGQGPYRSDKPEFAGNAAGFQWLCVGNARCRASLTNDGQGLVLKLVNGEGAETDLPLGRKDPARFVYDGNRGETETWPPAGPRQSLRAISLIDDVAQAPILVSRIWREEPMACDFDVVSQDCRQ